MLVLGRGRGGCLYSAKLTTELVAATFDKDQGFLRAHSPISINALIGTIAPWMLPDRALG